MEDDLITTKEVGDYRIKVYYCRDSECPITNWGLFGSFFFEYSDMHRLHDECNWKTFFYDNKHNLRDVIDAIVMKHIEQKDIVKYLKKGEANGISFTYNRGSNVWELKHKTSPYIDQEFSPSDLTDFDCRGELIEDLDDEDLLDIISKYGKDVVAIEWSTRGYNQGDYIKGIAYVTKLNGHIMSTSKEYRAVRNCILNELHLTKEDIIKNIEPLLEKHVKRYMVNTYGGDNQIENWIRCMVNDELKQRDHDFVRRACENVIRNHVLNELNIIVRSKSEKCTCENRVPSEEDKKESTDGLYIIYEDGHAEPFTGDNSKDCVRYIGLKHRYMSFAISLTEHDIVQLLDDDSREESGSGTYYERECDALFDIDGRGNTERLVARNPKLRNLLEDGEYIPSLGQLNLMAHYMNELNKAFAYVSASPLSSTWYWSSTESSQAVAWYVVFSSGLTGTGNKHIGDMVRTVIDF